MSVSPFLLVLSGGLIWLGIRQLNVNRRRIAEGITVKAKVISQQEHARGGSRPGTYFAPVLQFVTIQGETITVEPANPSMEWTVGQEIDILYHPDNPRDVIFPSKFYNYGVPFLLIFMGILSGLGAILR